MLPLENIWNAKHNIYKELFLINILISVEYPKVIGDRKTLGKEKSRETTKQVTQK